MCHPIIDKSLLNLVAIQISGAGIFAIFLKYNVPQLNRSFYSENPFAIKRDAIENSLTWFFVILALLGLCVQAYSIICGDTISERIHITSFYIKSLFAGIMAMVFVVYALGILGKNIARKKWLPMVIEMQSELYTISCEIVTNEGFYSNQLSNLETYSEEKREENSLKNYKEADEYISQIEDILDIKNTPSGRKEKLSNLSKYFK